VAADLKEIYRAASAVQAEMELNRSNPWGSKYQAIGKLWKENWAPVVPFLDFPGEVRKVIYTTNAVESLHMSLRKIIKSKMGHGAGLETGS
jgi:putative transposase